MRKKGYKDITLPNETWRKLAQFKLDKGKKNMGQVIEEILSIYNATEKAYNMAPNTVNVLSIADERWILEKERESEGILKGWN